MGAFGGAMAGVPVLNMEPQLNAAAELFGSFKEYQALSKEIHMEAHLPPTATKGSAEAAKLINETIMKTQPTEEKMLAVIEAAKTIAQQQLEEEKKFNKALEQYLKGQKDNKLNVVRK
jgi:hypothetical protein